MADLQAVIGDYTKFLDDLLDLVVKAGFDLKDFVQIDHICYRATSDQNYAEKKQDFEQELNFLGEIKVAGRLISTFRLSSPIIHGQWRIDAVELAAPKAGRDYKEGLEHAEFVLYDDFSTFLKKYEGKPFDMKAADRGINPEIKLQLGDYSVKFHLLNLPTVVYLQQKLGMLDAGGGTHQGSLG